MNSTNNDNLFLAGVFLFAIIVLGISNTSAKTTNQLIQSHLDSQASSQHKSQD